MRRCVLVLRPWTGCFSSQFSCHRDTDKESPQRFLLKSSHLPCFLDFSFIYRRTLPWKGKFSSSVHGSSCCPDDVTWHVSAWDGGRILREGFRQTRS